MMVSVLLIIMGIVLENTNFGNAQEYAVRLINLFGNSSREGRLEIVYSGIWGTVCDDHFTNASARVACARLGFGYIGTAIGNRHGAGTGQIWLDTVNCTGTETGIQNCAHNAWGVHDCNHGEDVSINCVDALDFAVRLNNSFGNSSKEGRLEIYYSGKWGTVCHNGFTNVSARVVCYSLGFGYIGSFIGNRYGPGRNPVWLNQVNCVGTERGIHLCSHDGWGTHNRSGHDHNQDVSISCAECGTQHFSGSTGRISSPNYPQQYVHNLQCYNFITVPAGYAIIITFLAFSTEKCCDWVTITCDSGNAYRSGDYKGFDFPAILTISSCRLVKVFFRTDGSSTSTGFSLTYNITSDNIIGGIATRPSNAFPLSDQNTPIIFNCTTATKYLPWWTFSDKSSTNYTITNSTCGIITSVAGSWFMTETLGPGSCNLIVTVRGNELHRRAGSLACIDSTLSSARAIILPISLELKSPKGINLMTTRTYMISEEEDRISCIPSFNDRYTSSSVVFTHFLYSGSPVVQMRILRTNWTSQGKIVSSTDISNTSSYVIVKALRDGVIPRHTCTIVFDFFSNISQLRAKSPIEISFSTEPINVLYWPTEASMTIFGDNNGHVRTPAVLYCNVAANPPATYTWIDENNGTITKGPAITVNHGGRYTCNASNTIGGQYYQVSKSLNLEVIKDETLTLTVLILGALLGVAVLFIIILLIILLCRKSRQENRITAGVGHETELQNRRSEGNCYANDCGNAADVAESESDDDNIYVNVSQ